jgi:hypothetical protein
MYMYIYKGEDVRAIVFVDTKVAAKLLCARLKCQFACLNPAYVVGHSDGIGT